MTEICLILIGYKDIVTAIKLYKQPLGFLPQTPPAPGRGPGPMPADAVPALTSVAEAGRSVELKAPSAPRLSAQTLGDAVARVAEPGEALVQPLNIH